MNDLEKAKETPNPNPSNEAGIKGSFSKDPNSPQTNVELQYKHPLQPGGIPQGPQGGYPNQFQPGPQYPFQPQPGQPQMLNNNAMPGQPQGFYQGNMQMGMGAGPYGGYGGYRPGPQQPMGFQGGPRQPFSQNQFTVQNGTGLNQPLLGGDYQNTGNRFGADNRGIPTQQESSGGAFGATQTACGNCTGYLAAYLPCCCCCFQNPYEIVPEGFAGVVQRFGKFYKLVGPGQHFLNRDVDTMILVDKREKLFELKRQVVVSKDNTSFLIDAVVYYRVVNTCKSKYAVANLQHSIEDLAVTTLRNVIGRLTLQEFLQKRDEIAEQVQQIVMEPASNWGTEVHRVLVQDVMLPNEARAAFSTGVLSKKIAEAQVISAKADVEAARLMKEAADALNTQAALQIRYLEALDHVSKSVNPKMVFFPADYKDVGTVNDHFETDVERLISEQEHQ